jgi:ribosomal protein S3AE
MAQEKKKFLPVKIAVINKEIELLGMNYESLNNRYVKLDLTSDLRGKSIELKLVVTANDKEATASPVEAYLLGFYIRRMMRKGTDYVEDSFLTPCKDHRIRIKPFLITRKRVSQKIRAALRSEAKKELIEYSKNKTFENLILDMFNNKIQKELGQKLKKIYPLGLCEIRFLGIEDSKEYVAEVIKPEQEEVEYEQEVKEVKKVKEKKPKKESTKKKEESDGE